MRAAGEGEGLDRLVRLAARVLRVPVAMVSFITGDREVIRAAVGLPEPWASQRWTPLSHSLCAQVVDQEGPVVLFDARTDPAYRAHAAVVEMGAGAYAGFPLRHGEHVLGAFCAADVVPRRWSEDDLQLLEDLAAAVSVELSLRVALEELEAVRSRERELARRLREGSRTDPVTGAADRRALDERLAEETARLARRPGELALVLLEVDGFARVTGIAGRRTADAVLAEVAARLHVALRRTDLLARTGDHEFAVVLPGTGARAAEELAQRLGHLVAEEPVAGWDVTVTTATAVHHPDRGADGLLADAAAAPRVQR